MTLSPNFLDIAFLGFIGSLEKRRGDIRNKYGVGEFIFRSDFRRVRGFF